MQFSNPEAVLVAARIGFEAQIAEIDRELGQIRKEAKSRNGVTSLAAPRTGIRQVAEVDTAGESAPRKKRRTMTAAARKRIAAAQKKRWAAQKATAVA